MRLDPEKKAEIAITNIKSMNSTIFEQPVSERIKRTGLGIRPELFKEVIEQRPDLGFLEAHSENYFGSSLARTKLWELRQDYDVSLHGVGLSLGRADNLNQQHLAELKSLVDEIEPLIVSEHLAWSAYSHRHLPDLLPLPLTEDSLAIMCEHVKQMQDLLQRQILVENPSNYLLFDQLQMSEPEFLNRLVQLTGCGVLLDINNVYVSSINLQRNPRTYLDQLESQAIGQYHLAGFTEVQRQGQTVLIDTHNKPVYPEVWELFERAVAQHGRKPTLLEWDSDFPELTVLLSQCSQANEVLDRYSHDVNICSNQTKTEAADRSEEIIDHNISSGKAGSSLELAQGRFLDQLIKLEDNLPMAIGAHKNRIWIYQNNVFAATREHLSEVYPAVLGLVGSDFFKQMTQVFTQQYPPDIGNINRYGDDFHKVINEFSALKEMPYLADLIAYEWALHDLYFVDTPDLIDPNKFAQSDLLHLPIALSCCAVLINSKFPIYEIHRQSLPDYTQEVSIDLAQSQDSVLVFKRGYSVEAKLLDVEQLSFIDAMSKSDNLLQAMEHLHGSMSTQALSANLALMLDLQLLTHARSSQAR
jgi:uncharacterized protein (UPF0276 family)